MHTIELSDEELQLLHAALHSYLVKALISKLPRPG